MDNNLREALLQLLKVFYRRYDLRVVFPEVLYQDYSRLLEWSLGVVQKEWRDSDYEVLKPFTDQFKTLLFMAKNRDPSLKKLQEDELRRLSQLRDGKASITHIVRCSTIIIPAYRKVSNLRQILIGLNDQTTHNFEVVVVSDGCDKVISFMKKFKSSFNHSLKVYNTNYKQGFGAAFARNLGASVAEGEQLIFLDSDMIIGSNLIEIHQRNYENNCLLVGWIDWVDPKSGKLLLIDERRGFFDEKYADGEDFWTGNASVDTASFIELGGFDMAFLNQGGEDSDFGLRHFSKFGKIKYLFEAKTKHLGEESFRAHTLNRTLQFERLNSDRNYYKDPKNWVANGGESFFSTHTLNHLKSKGIIVNPKVFRLGFGGKKIS